MGVHTIPTWCLACRKYMACLTMNYLGDRAAPLSPSLWKKHGSPQTAQIGTWVVAMDHNTPTPQPFPSSAASTCPFLILCFAEKRDFLCLAPKTLWGLFYKGTNFIHKCTTLMNLSPLRGHTSTCYHTRYEVSAHGLRKNTNIQTTVQHSQSWSPSSFSLPWSTPRYIVAHTGWF